MATLTSTAQPFSIHNGWEGTISPPINGMFPQELTVVSGDATAFTASLVTTTMSGTTTISTSCAYTSAGPYRMLRSSCSGIANDTVRAFSNLELVVSANAEGVGEMTLQASVSALEDNKRCTADSCDPTTGVSHTNVQAGASCSVDNQVCNGVEACDGAGGCVASGNAPAGTPCSDGNPCNGFESCNGAGTCAAGTPLPAGTSCSDGNACNGEERCSSGACQPGTPVPASVHDDHDPCTTDSCDPARGGIVNDPISGCSSSTSPPPLATTRSERFDTSTAFLYSGATPVQTGVGSGTIDGERAAVIRGRVLSASMVADENPPPFPGAVVSILGHPEYGQTLTRSDGFYDLAVNGGGPLTVQITAAGALKIQRRAVTKRHGWTLIDDVRLTATVTSADTFTEGAPTAQVVRGSVTASDGDPTRSALLYFPPGTAFTNFTSPGGRWRFRSPSTRLRMGCSACQASSRRRAAIPTPSRSVFPQRLLSVSTT